jgi:hypothetical protein
LSILPTTYLFLSFEFLFDDAKVTSASRDQVRREETDADLYESGGGGVIYTFFSRPDGTLVVTIAGLKKKEAASRSDTWEVVMNTGQLPMQNGSSSFSNTTHTSSLKSR